MSVDPVASAYLGAGQSSTKRHLRSREAPSMAACGRAWITVASAVDAGTVPAGDRCRQSGCIGRWAAIDRGAAS